MRAVVLVAALLVGCSAQAAQPIATPTPLVIYTTAPTPAPHVLDRRAFTVGLFYASEQDRETATELWNGLPAAWSAATNGASSVSLVGDTGAADVYVFVGPEPPAQMPEGVQFAWYIRNPEIRFVYIHRLPAGKDALLVLVHELAHAIGCCQGAPSADADGHWTDCASPSVEIMCHFQGTATTFSERELRAMGL